MERVQGIGGIFFKARDPRALAAWYRDHLGVPTEDWGGASIRWAEQDNPDTAYTVWSPFQHDTTYFAPSSAPFMMNFRVRDLEAILAQLRAAGCTVLSSSETNEFGKFGWVIDPEGNKVELWEPAPAGP